MDFERLLMQEKNGPRKKENKPIRTIIRKRTHQMTGVSAFFSQSMIAMIALLHEKGTEKDNADGKKSYRKKAEIKPGKKNAGKQSKKTGKRRCGYMQNSRKCHNRQCDIGHVI